MERKLFERICYIILGVIVVGIAYGSWHYIKLNGPGVGAQPRTPAQRAQDYEEQTMMDALRRRNEFIRECEMGGHYPALSYNSLFVCVRQEAVVREYTDTLVVEAYAREQFRKSIVANDGGAP